VAGTQRSSFQRVVKVCHAEGEGVLKIFDGNVRQQHGTLLRAGQSRQQMVVEIMNGMAAENGIAHRPAPIQALDVARTAAE